MAAGKSQPGNTLLERADDAAEMIGGQHRNDRRNVAAADAADAADVGSGSHGNVRGSPSWVSPSLIQRRIDGYRARSKPPSWATRV